MRIADLAKELKITETIIVNKLKALKLKSKDDGLLTAGVEMIVRDSLADEGIGKRIAEEEEPKKKIKKTVATKTTTAKKKETVKKEPSEKTVKSKKTAGEKPEKKTKKFVPALVKEEGEPPAVKPKESPKVAVEAPVAPAPAPVKPEVKVQPPPVSAPVKVEPPKVQQPSAPVQPPPLSAKPVVDLSKIEIPRELPSEAAAKKKPHFDAPFETVKPLLKKRKSRPEDGVGGHGGRSDIRPSSTITNAVVAPAPTGPVQDIDIPFPITVNSFAVRINQKSNVVLKKLLEMRIFANINQNLSEDIATKLAAAFGYNLIIAKTKEEELVDVHKQQQEDPSLLKPRAPVVTFMGHVDHGKTSLLDRIRSEKVADSEHGGITQHIGSYSVKMPKGRITFLDTPGHEAFTAMRARGAHVTDIVVLVVAADDGIMPQTIEAIDHAKAANVPIVVALNKIDKKTANPDRVKKQLMEYDLAPEDWGGKTVVIGVSAVTGEGVNQLLELILLEAELLELKANPDKKASGIVIEAQMSKGRGPVATLLVQSGTLKEGDGIVVGPHFGRVKALFDDHKRAIKEAGPSTPLEMIGLSEVPAAGEMFYAVQDERTARQIAEDRQEKLKDERLSGTAKVSLEDLYAQIQQGAKELRIIIKADVQGSVEAIKEALGKISSNEVKLRIMHSAAGDVNASDVLLAVASESIIIAFNVSVDTKAKEELEKTPVDVRKYRIIYDAVDDVKKALEGLLAPKLKRHFVGKIEIRNVFKLSRSGVVAGCYVQKGKVRSKNQIDILRNGNVIHTGQIGSLKRFKDDVKEVTENFECGIVINNFTDIQVGDIIEAFEIESIARKL
jgi:translation initiation factor IF-2